MSSTSSDGSSSSPDNDDIPMYLMPGAAVLGVYSLIAVLRIASILYGNFAARKGPRKQQRLHSPTVPVPSQAFIFLVTSCLLSLLGYAYLVAKIEASFQAAEYAMFDPYAILELPNGVTNTTVIKTAYRARILQTHPDKPSGSATAFQQVQLALKALTDEAAKANFAKYGHPNGPLKLPTFSLALPSWLLFPKGKFSAVLLLVYLGLIGLFIFVVMYKLRAPASAKKQVNILDQSNSVSVDDLLYLTTKLRPDSKRLDILYAVISVPELVRFSTTKYNEIEQKRRERIETLLNAKTKPKLNDYTDLLDDDGWGGDDDDDHEDDQATQEARSKAKDAELEKQQALERLKTATGKTTELLEGIDKGVIGQKWVEATLNSSSAWPPSFEDTILADQRFDYQGKQLSALDHPGMRRILCMTLGRLHANTLNSHTELLEAGAKKLVDQTYFREAMEFRQRVSILLEATLRVAVALRSHQLMETTVETIVMFKLGTTQVDDVTWFNQLMERQYNCVPRLFVKDRSIATVDEKSVAAGDFTTLTLELERPFAEQFFQTKVAMFTKQGIPPQMGLQTYREGWWILIKAERIDGKVEPDPLNREHAIVSQMDEQDIARFEALSASERLLTAYPITIPNVALNACKMRTNFHAPSVPGKYRVFVTIKSQEFLGADQTFAVDLELADAAALGRPVKTVDDVQKAIEKFRAQAAAQANQEEADNDVAAGKKVN